MFITIFLPLLMHIYSLKGYLLMLLFASLGFHDNGYHIFVIKSNKYEDNEASIL